MLSLELTGDRKVYLSTVGRLVRSDVLGVVEYGFPKVFRAARRVLCYSEVPVMLKYRFQEPS